MISPAYYLVLAALLFAVGLAGVLLRRNVLVVLMSIELMLSAVGINLVAFGRMWNSVDGQVFALFALVVAAAQAAVGIGIVVLFFRQRPTADADEMDLLKW